MPVDYAAPVGIPRSLVNCSRWFSVVARGACNGVLGGSDSEADDTARGIAVLGLFENSRKSCEELRAGCYGCLRLCKDLATGL